MTVTDTLEGDCTYSRFRNKYWWPHAYEDIKKYLSNCHVCQLFDKTTPPAGAIFPFTS